MASAADDEEGPGEDVPEEREAPPDSRAVRNRADWKQFRSVFKNNTALAANLYEDRQVSQPN